MRSLETFIDADRYLYLFLVARTGAYDVVAPDEQDRTNREDPFAQRPDCLNEPPPG